MSEQDRDLLARAGLSAAKVAKILDRSRQAVSKGLSAKTDYLTPANLLEMHSSIQTKFPESAEPFQEVVRDVFRGLAERLGSSMPDRIGMAATVAAARRLWLILPAFNNGFEKQPAPYVELLQMIDQRRPGKETTDQLEVITFCDQSRAGIEEQFDESWFKTRQLAVIQCGLVGQMFTPIIVVDPHLDGGTACYTLAQNGFEPLEPETARSRVNEFAEQVSEKIRCFAQAGGRPLNVLTAAPEVLLAAGLHRKQI